MNNHRKAPNLKGRAFNGIRYPKIKRIRQEPRHNIRQLLRSFIPLNQPESNAKDGPENQP